jgi:hypothetical protein
LSSRWNLLPQLVRDWRTGAHAAGLSTQLRLGNLDP